MEFSEKLKERFCKDRNLPIKIFKEPFFTDRLTALNPFYDCIKDYDMFQMSFKYDSEQDYFEHYNQVKDNAINAIKESEGFIRFNSCDMQEFSVSENLPSSDIYKPQNDGKHFISIDMKKANFSALHHYDRSIFNFALSWEYFISNFTNNPHIRSSKYIRQVILGNCNPKRHVTYEKHLTYGLLNHIRDYCDSLNDYIVFFSNDEIVLKGEISEKFNIANLVAVFSRTTGIPFRVTDFVLHKIEGTNDGYYKDIDDGSEFEFKCLEPYEIPFVIRAAIGQEPNILDKYFIYEKRLACLDKAIEINIPKLIK